MIDPFTDRLLSMKAVCRMLPGRNGRPLAISTCYRWIFTGRRGFRLDSVVGGGQRYTSEDAIRKFVAQTTAASTASDQSVPVRADPNVEAKLNDLGF